MPPVQVSPSFFTKAVTLERPVVSKDAAGGATRVWAAVGADSTDVPAAVQPLNARDLALFAGRNIQVSLAVYLQGPIGFTRGDRLAVSDGRYLTVAGEIDFGGAGRLYRLACRELLE
jgi:head-tail adaptor